MSRDDGGRVYAKLRERCGPRREKTEKNSERRKAGGKKIVRAITHPLDTWESGIPLASQTSFLSLDGSGLYAERTNLFPSAGKKKTSPDAAPCLGIRSVE